MSTEDRDWWLAEAGEYVLGTLSNAEAKFFEEQMRDNPSLHSMVLYWQERLQPLASTVQPIDPPARVWQKISRQLQLGDQATNKQLTTTQTSNRRHTGERRSGSELLSSKHRRLSSKKLNRKVNIWRGATALATAASLVLATTLWVQNENDQDSALQYKFDTITVVSDENTNPLWIVDASSTSKSIRLTALAPPELASDKSYELWMVKPDNQGVVSLGLLPTTAGESAILNAPGLNASAIALAVSVEPTGGSPDLVPTGPVLFQGKVQQLKRMEKSI